MSDLIELVASAIANKIHRDALAFNLREIGQEDKFNEWLAAYPVKITDNERALARVAIQAIGEDLARCQNSSLGYAGDELLKELRERA